MEKIPGVPLTNLSATDASEYSGDPSEEVARRSDFEKQVVERAIESADPIDELVLTPLLNEIVKAEFEEVTPGRILDAKGYLQEITRDELESLRENYEKFCNAPETGTETDDERHAAKIYSIYPIVVKALEIMGRRLDE